MSSSQPENSAKDNTSSPLAKNAIKVQWFTTLQWVSFMLAFILTATALGSCNEIKFSNTSGTSTPSSLTLQFGTWRYQGWALAASEGDMFVMESCHQYPDYIDLDSTWKAARVFSILTLVFALLVVFLNTLHSCASDPEKTKTRWLEAPMLLLTTLCQGLSLLLLSSSACKNNQMVNELSSPLRDIDFQDTCSISTGSKVFISATVFYFLSACHAYFGFKAKKKERELEIEAGLVEPLMEQPSNA